MEGLNYMNTHQIHTKLADSIRRLSVLRKELAAEHCSVSTRVFGRLQQAYFETQIAVLIHQLRTI